MLAPVERIALALVVTLGVAPPPSRASDTWLDVTLHGGVDEYDSVRLEDGLSVSDFTEGQQLRDTSLTLGATGTIRLGLLEVGVLGEVGRPGRANTTATVGALAGLSLGLGRVLIEALGEVGGRRYGDALHNPSVILDSNRSDWLAYVGVRPGISVRLGDEGHSLLGVWGYARWDVTNKDIPVTLADGVGAGWYDLGGSQIGVALRLGLSL